VNVVLGVMFPGNVPVLIHRVLFRPVVADLFATTNYRNAPDNFNFERQFPGASL